MSPRYMLDTDTVIFIRSSRQPVVDRFDMLRVGEAVISMVSYGELRFGAEESRDKQRALSTLDQSIASIPVETLPLAAAEVFGEVKAHLSFIGEIIGANDLWIAAHARAAGLTLVTGNEREFRRVPGLSVENWAAA